MESKVLNAIAAYEAEILDFTKEMVNIDSGVDCPRLRWPQSLRPS